MVLGPRLIELAGEPMVEDIEKFLQRAVAIAKTPFQQEFGVMHRQRTVGPGQPKEGHRHLRRLGELVTLRRHAWAQIVDFSCRRLQRQLRGKAHGIARAPTWRLLARLNVRAMIIQPMQQPYRLIKLKRVRLVVECFRYTRIALPARGRHIMSAFSR